MTYMKLRFDFDEVVSRTVVVPAEWSLAFLHLVIQETFGWLNCHLHEFRLESMGTDAWVEDPDANAEMDPDMTFKPTNKTSIATFFPKKGSSACSIYDFGDYNEVTIQSLGSVEKPSPVIAAGSVDFPLMPRV